MTKEEAIEYVMEAPIGIKPRYIWEYERIDEMLNAMERYSNAKRYVPVDWICELREHFNRMR